MNFDALWQQHRKFLTGVAVGVVVFLAGKALIGATVGAELKQAQSSIRGSKTALAKPGYGAAEVARLEQSLRDWQARAVDLEQRTLPPLPEAYRPRKGQSPAQHYIEWTGARRQELIRAALLQNVNVDEGLGLPPTSPTQPQVIERVLRGFYVVDQVVQLAVEHRARAVEEIEISIRPQKRAFKGLPPSPLDVAPVTLEVLLAEERLAPFLDAVCRHDPPLGLVTLDLTAPERRGGAPRRVFLEFSPGVVPELAGAEQGAAAR